MATEKLDRILPGLQLLSQPSLDLNGGYFERARVNFEQIDVHFKSELYFRYTIETGPPSVT